MQEGREPEAFMRRRPLEETRGGWALFGRLLIWSMRNNQRGPDFPAAAG